MLNRLREILHFVIHLRWHYQVGILSGGYLLGGLYAGQMDWQVWIAQFINVHLLLFGGATAYNSFWDKDEGPVGGLRHPPPMKKWMWSASLMMQFMGALWALRVGPVFEAFYLLSMLLFWLYSTPHARWKGHPYLSLIAIGISTGTNSFWMGYLAAGYSGWIVPMVASLGVAAVILSLYPVSQIFQVEEDEQRGDLTLARQIGSLGLRRFFQVFFITGIFLVAITFPVGRPWLGILFGMIGLLLSAWIRWTLLSITGSREDYNKVMRIKYITSMAFVLFIGVMLVFKHT